MDGTGAYYTEWSNPERKTPIQYTNAYVWNLESWWWQPFKRDSKIDTEVQNSLLDSVGEGEGGMIWENAIETCLISYIKWIISPGFMHDTGCLGLVHWGRPRGMIQGGWSEGASGWGTRVYLWWIHVDVWQNQYNIVQ